MRPAMMERSVVLPHPARTDERDEFTFLYVKGNILEGRVAAFEEK